MFCLDISEVHKCIHVTRDKCVELFDICTIIYRIVYMYTQQKLSESFKKQASSLTSKVLSQSSFIKIIQITAGGVVRPQKRKYRQLDSRLQSLIEQLFQT